MNKSVQICFCCEDFLHLTFKRRRVLLCKEDERPPNQLQPLSVSIKVSNLQLHQRRCWISNKNFKTFQSGKRPWSVSMWIHFVWENADILLLHYSALNSYHTITIEIDVISLFCDNPWPGGLEKIKNIVLNFYRTQAGN